MSGTLYGLGVGPGDPELITVKALRLLRSAPVLAYPAPETGDSLARSIVADLLPGGQEEVPIRFPLKVERFPAQEVYDRAAIILGRHLDAGRDVAVLCEGDPFFYGSFIFLFARMAEAHTVEVVPGVSSLTACAAMLEAPLATRNEVLTVVPGPLGDPELKTHLSSGSSIAIIKVGRHFRRIRDLLQDLGLGERARYVEHATMASQKILPLDRVDPDGVPYFSMILVRDPMVRWA
ncbi:MAG: precorrin-2 C(20)-methyltransferase [Hyphomicrobiales bacterium]|nr:precorrin-2 C(20)-methyltransferase [Hyphomicrobiales bacterium]